MKDEDIRRSGEMVGLGVRDGGREVGVAV